VPAVPADYAIGADLFWPVLELLIFRGPGGI